MPFSSRLDGIISKAKGRIEQYQQDFSGQSAQRPAPQSSYYPASAPHYYTPPGVPQQQAYPPPQQQYIPQAPLQPAFYYRPVFSPQNPVSANFKHQLGAHGWGNNEAQNYTDSHANSFHTPNHGLVLRAIANSSAPPGQQYTSARLTSHQTLGRDRGCIQVRLTAPSAAGVWPAFWALPREPFTWPSEGEVDIFEAWNGDKTNHACLHWGHFNGEDWDKHRVVETPVPELDHPEGRLYAWAWDQPPSGQGGRMVWYVDGRPVMKAAVPPGTRRLSDWQIIMNVAMGGNVNGGVLPADGVYDMVVHSLKFSDGPNGGWAAFEQDWAGAPEGHAM